MKTISPTVTDLLRQASLRGGAAPARSRQPVAALFIQDNEPRSACPASAESLVACAGLSYACSPGLLTRRTPRLFARPLAIRRRGTTARPIPAASAPLVANPFGTPSAGDTSVILLLDHGFRLPASVAHERPLDSRGQRVEEEPRHLVEALVHVLDGAPAGSASPRGIRARVFHAIVLLFTVLSLSFGWLCNRVLYSVRRRNGQRFCIRSHQAFQAGGGGSPASEERKFAGVRGARSATRRLAEGNG